jgi:hypothetical protein
MRSGRDEILVVRTPDDLTVFIPVEWTDRACPSPDTEACGAARFEALSLIEVAVIARRLLDAADRDVDKS